MTINLTNIFKKYKGLWIGLKDDNKTVVASGKTVEEVMEKSEKKGIKQPILFKVSQQSLLYR